ncbi:MAG: hypothetical protein LUQ14_01010, partial [Methanomassiliicoccales archaeon]|nr:hypothetical protein [Methanomassiliicoccales archaeon]
APKFGEMIITCEYCGNTISLGNEGWGNINKQTMLPIKFADKSKIDEIVRDLLGAGLLRKRFHDDSVLEEVSLSLVPYWIVSASARTSIVASDIAVEAGKVAAAAALAGLMGGKRRGATGSVAAGTILGSSLGGGGAKKSFDISDTYNFPIVALKHLEEYQPKEYQFRLDERTFFDMTKVPEGVKVLNGDVGEETAKQQAKALVTELQSKKAHDQYRMIQQLHTEVEMSETELLHAPIWLSRYDYKGKKMMMVIDGNTGGVINSVGL